MLLPLSLFVVDARPSSAAKAARDVPGARGGGRGSGLCTLGALGLGLGLGFWV